jgi:hypothetical protein
MAGTNWGMCGSGVGGTGAMTRVWPMEFDPNRWPGEESELRNAEAYDVIIDAIQYVTPSEYQSRVGKPHTRLFFKISPYMRDGKVVGGYVEVAQKPRQVSPQAKIPEPEPVHDMDAYHKGIDGLD